MNPFTMPGPDFLQLYIVVLVVACGVAVGLRWWMRQPGDPVPAGLDWELTPYEIAFLAGGVGSALDACLLRLIHRRVLGVSAESGRVTRLETKVPDDAHPLEKMMAVAVSNNSSVEVKLLREIAEPTADALRGRLEKMGLVLTHARANQICLACAGVIFAVLLFGLIKLFIGLAGNRPVGYLVGMLLVALVPMILFLVRRPFRSRRGDETLRVLCYENDALKQSAGTRFGMLTDADMIIALGLFGSTVLLGSPFVHVMPLLRRRATESSSGSSGSCSSCSSSSCGGGGGDGGGGCGGGGCGGCGGGGD